MLSYLRRCTSPQGREQRGAANPNRGARGPRQAAVCISWEVRFTNYEPQTMSIACVHDVRGLKYGVVGGASTGPWRTKVKRAGSFVVAVRPAGLGRLQGLGGPALLAHLRPDRAEPCNRPGLSSPPVLPRASRPAHPACCPHRHTYLESCKHPLDPPSRGLELTHLAPGFTPQPLPPQQETPSLWVLSHTTDALLPEMSLTFALEQSSRQLRDLLRNPSSTLKATMLAPTTLLGGSPTSLVMTSKSDIWAILHCHTLVKITAQGLILNVIGKRGTSGYKDGSILEALFDFGFWLSGIGELQIGDIVFTDPNNHRLRALSANECSVTTLAGTGAAGHLDGPAEQAIFNHPASLVIAMDQSIFISDVSNRCLRILRNGTVTTLSEAPQAGKPFDPELLLPAGLAYSPKGQLIVSDSLDHSICRVTQERMTCLAGSTKGYVDGAIDEARICSPTGLALTSAGDLLVCDAGNHAVRILMEGRISTVFAPKDIPALSRDSQTPGTELSSVWPRAIVLGPDALIYLADLQGIVLLSGPAQFSVPLPDDLIRGSGCQILPASSIATTIQQHLVPLAEILSRQLTMIDIRFGMLKLVRTTSLLLHQCSLHIAQETGDRPDSFQELIARTVSIMHDVSALIITNPSSELVVRYLQLLRECYLSFLMFF